MTLARHCAVHDFPSIRHLALVGAAILLLAANCGSGSEERADEAAKDETPDAVAAARNLSTSGWTLHEEEPDPLTDTVVHRLSNEVPNLQKDGPSLRFYMQCREGTNFQDFRFGDVGIRFSEVIYDLERGRFDFYGNYETTVGVRWDQNEADYQLFWRRTLGRRARGGLYTSAGPLDPLVRPVSGSGRVGGIGRPNEEISNQATRIFIERMATHHTLLLRFYQESYPHLDYRFDLQGFAEKAEDLRERCGGLADDS